MLIIIVAFVGIATTSIYNKLLRDEFYAEYHGANLVYVKVVILESVHRQLIGLVHLTGVE
jgi:hypothetical protein